MRSLGTPYPVQNLPSVLGNSAARHVSSAARFFNSFSPELKLARLAMQFLCTKRDVSAYDLFPWAAQSNTLHIANREYLQRLGHAASISALVLA